MARAGSLRVVNAVLEDRTITHVIVNNKNGLAAYKAKCFIDCTGDADLIKLVGASYQSGNHNRVNQPVSLRFDMAGIDFERFHAYMRSLGNDQYKYFAMNTPGMKDIIRKAYENGVLTEQDACYFQAFGIPGRPDGMNFNCPELTTKENVVDAEFMTQKQLEGKKAIMRLRKFLRDYIPGFENAYITSIAQLVGFRESRRIEAEYMLTIEDVLTYRKFPDGIAASHYPIDVHGVNDVSLGLKYQHDVPADEQYWEVPFRVMIPKTLDNVLTAGRCAGMDFRAQSAARIQPTCRSMGEAAGIAALEDVEYVSRTRDVLAGERAWLFHELSSLGLSVVPSDANFLLVRTPAKDIPERLYKQGVLVRTCDSFSVLSRFWCRVAVRTRKENARLAMAFSRALRAEGASGEGEPDKRGCASCSGAMAGAYGRGSTKEVDTRG